jgi:hypothetical protein
MEVGHVVIQIRLADLGVGGEDVHDKRAEIDGIETFDGVIKNSIVDIINRCRELVAFDGEDHLEVFQALQAMALVVCSSLYLAVMVPAGMTG